MGARAASIAGHLDVVLLGPAGVVIVAVVGPTNRGEDVGAVI